MAVLSFLIPIKKKASEDERVTKCLHSVHADPSGSDSPALI